MEGEERVLKTYILLLSIAEATMPWGMGVVCLNKQNGFVILNLWNMCYSWQLAAVQTHFLLGICLTLIELAFNIFNKNPNLSFLFLKLR